MSLKINLVSLLHNGDGVKQQSLTNSNSNIYISPLSLQVSTTQTHIMQTPFLQSRNSHMINMIQHRIQKQFLQFRNSCMINMISHICVETSLLINMIQHRIQKQFLQFRNSCMINMISHHLCRNQPFDKYDIAQNTGTITVEQKQPYNNYDIAQNTGTIPVEQKQHYDKYDIAHNT